jgi:catechol 2,3-dioxygenase-like lactoylglutathione lyase family enzyme
MAADTNKKVPFKLEIVVIPVSDVDRAKTFYGQLGWRLDADFADGKDYRVVQFTPPGSDCSIIFGTNVTPAKPGTQQGLYLIVENIEMARAQLVSQGIEVSPIFHSPDNEHSGADQPFLFGRKRIEGLDPGRGSYKSFASFNDPDGNGWLLQEITTRLPGRVENHAAYSSVPELAAALRRAAAAHGRHEAQINQKDENWPDWYAAFMLNEFVDNGGAR